MATDVSTPRLAARCRYLRMTMGVRADANLVNLCTHIIRDGRDCVGPFLDDHETHCGLWEPKDPAAR
ncbi:MAG TPA: hypothetical protein PKA49_15455 [Tepidiformaceae bacterium]|nr:hypothetical protein [Thermoflexaceae bacterium]HMS60235.1 hypothetical protein [Tepidiformaceae bacterium]